MLARHRPKVAQDRRNVDDLQSKRVTVAPRAIATATTIPTVTAKKSGADQRPVHGARRVHPVHADGRERQRE
jgi:hypothetical protein